VTVLFSIRLLAITGRGPVGGFVTTVAVKKVHQRAHEKNNKRPVLKHMFLMPTPQIIRSDYTEKDVKCRSLAFAIDLKIVVR
jgi:hypothetical protein